MVNLAREVSIWVYNVVFSYVQNKEDAEEIVQDTLLATLSGLEKFKNESSLKTWVYSIAINKAKDVLKYRKRKKRYGKVVSIYQDSADGRHFNEPANFTHPGIELESKEQMDLLFGAINQLPEKQKTAIILAKLEGMSMKEISSVMACSPKAVESLLSRARNNLKAYLEAEGIKIYKKSTYG